MINDEAITCLSKLPTNLELDASSLIDVGKAIKQMTSGKAPSPDTIPVEVFKTYGESIRN